MREALFWEKAGSGDSGAGESGAASTGVTSGGSGEKPDASESPVRCTLCFRRCVLKDGQAGFCGVRVNRGGTLFTLVDDNVVSMGLDPVEKKPLYHFLPTTRTLSIGTYGCNFACRFCQNSRISRSVADTGRFTRGRTLTARGLVAAALREKAPSVSCTYNEPTVFYELMCDVADAALASGLRVIMVSNGGMSPEALAGLRGRVHAANIDLKAFNQKFYGDICSGSLKVVLENLQRLKDMDVWLEVTTLVIPGLNDSDEELGSLARFIREKLDADTPWHVSAFHPSYAMLDRPPTPPATVHHACEIGRAEGLHYVYGGNVLSTADGATRCPSCGKACLERIQFRVLTPRPFDGVCPSCGAKIAGVWK